MITSVSPNPEYVVYFVYVCVCVWDAHWYSTHIFLHTLPQLSLSLCLCVCKSLIIAGWSQDVIWFTMGSLTLGNDLDSAPQTRCVQMDFTVRSTALCRNHGQPASEQDWMQPWQGIINILMDTCIETELIIVKNIQILLEQMAMPWECIIYMLFKKGLCVLIYTTRIIHCHTQFCYC